MFKNLVGILALASTLLIIPTACAGDKSTEAVLTHHLESFGAGNLEAILSDYSEDSVIIVPDGVLSGMVEIEALYTALIAEFSKPGMKFELTDTKIEGPIAYITWQAETADDVYNFATDTFVIENGTITYQTLALVVTPKEN